jgi:hypothetical protein
MRNYGNPDKPGKISQRQSAAAVGGPLGSAAGYCLLLFFVVGCSSGPGGPDALVGEIYPQKQNSFGPNPPATPTSSTKTSNLGPDPLLSSALADIPNSRPSPIINDQIATNGFNNSAATTGFTRNAGGGPTVLPLYGQASGSYGQSRPTLESLQSQLRAHKVIWQKQETLPDGTVRFSCIAPNKYNPESSTAYDATARDIVTAIQAVLAKIDQP